MITNVADSLAAPLTFYYMIDSEIISLHGSFLIKNKFAYLLLTSKDDGCERNLEFKHAIYLLNRNKHLVTKCRPGYKESSTIFRIFTYWNLQDRLNKHAFHEVYQI